MHEICTISFNLSKLLLVFIHFKYFISFYLYSFTYFNAFSAPCCNAFILCEVLWIVLYMKCATNKFDFGTNWLKYKNLFVCGTGLKAHVQPSVTSHTPTHTLTLSGLAGSHQQGKELQDIYTLQGTSLHTMQHAHARTRTHTRTHAHARTHAHSWGGRDNSWNDCSER